MTTDASGTHCPVCGRSGMTFLPLPDFYREHAERHGFVHFGKGEMTALATYACPECGASDRERLCALWIRQEMGGGRLATGARLLHFAPETALRRMIGSLALFDYRTCDISMADVDSREDLMGLSFASESFDLFLCSHVLEHVPDDGIALAELFRVTRVGGRGILLAPVMVGLAQTLEDWSVSSEADRWRLFGQHDHVRLYSHDGFVRKIRESGFHLEQLDASHFGAEAFERLGLKPTSILYVVERR